MVAPIVLSREIIEKDKGSHARPEHGNEPGKQESEHRANPFLYEGDDVCQPVEHVLSWSDFGRAQIIVDGPVEFRPRLFRVERIANSTRNNGQEEFRQAAHGAEFKFPFSCTQARVIDQRADDLSGAWLDEAKQLRDNAFPKRVTDHTGDVDPDALARLNKDVY